MDRSKIILIIVFVLGIGGAAHNFYSYFVDSRKKDIALAEERGRDSAAAAEKAKMAALKKETDARAAAAQALLVTPTPVAVAAPNGSNGTPALTTELTIGTPKIATPKLALPRALMDAPPAPGQTIPPVISAAEAWIATAHLTSTALGTPRFAIINKRGYEQGARVPLPGGLTMTLTRIEDGFVIFEGDGWHFKMRLTTVKE